MNLLFWLLELLWFLWFINRLSSLFYASILLNFVVLSLLFFAWIVLFWVCWVLVIKRFITILWVCIDLHFLSAYIRSCCRELRIARCLIGSGRHDTSSTKKILWLLSVLFDMQSRFHLILLWISIKLFHIRRRYAFGLNWFRTCWVWAWLFCRLLLVRGSNLGLNCHWLFLKISCWLLFKIFIKLAFNLRSRLMLRILGFMRFFTLRFLVFQLLFILHRFLNFKCP